MSFNIGSWLVTYRFALSAMALVIATALAWGVQYSEFDGSPEAVLAEGDPFKAEVDQAKRRLPAQHLVVICLSSR